ncbi:A118 family phage portal protein, putative [Helcococcus kunzii ATCC 51366]|uniref:A118 family phage portal protein, putative n=1 Tax=Helcococcus kunzii ATCC 51366 TaxID=883114 RepID=H3NPD7_9FIRM|nr:phage portal protein [Helcococcus kunzii]EHR33450.1 A118 family phage portal protein, putative [Helcococcus kunzii ATCC 51366]
MFDKVKSFFRRIYTMIFPVESVDKALNIKIPVNAEMGRAIQRWKDIYLNKAKYIKSGDKTMELPAAIASELARLTTIEMKSEITVSNNTENKLNDFYQIIVEKLRVQTEYAIAMGGLMLKPYLDDNKISVEFVKADRFVPVGFTDGEMTSVIFIEQFIEGDNTYTRLELHELAGINYYVTNRAYKKGPKDYGETPLGREIKLSSVGEWKGLEENIVIENVEKPLFSYFKMPFANNIDPDSNLGVSVYSKAESLIQEASEMWNRINWEYKAKEVALEVSETMIKDNKFPEGKERLFRKYSIDKQGDDTFYNVYSPEIRDSSHYNGLNKILQRVEFNCGLAYGTLSDVQEVEKTAEEIKTSKQRSYTTISDIQKSLQIALEQLVYGMCIFAKFYNIGKFDDYEISFEWDDSIIVDRKTDANLMLQELAAGLIKPEYYLMYRYGVTESQAKEMLPNSENTQTDYEVDDSDA